MAKNDFQYGRWNSSETAEGAEKWGVLSPPLPFSRLPALPSPPFLFPPLPSPTPPPPLPLEVGPFKSS